MRLLISSLTAAALMAPALNTHAAEPQTLQEKLAEAATIKAPDGALRTFQLIDECVRLKRGDPMMAFDEVKQQSRAWTDAESEAARVQCAGLTDELTAARMDYLDRAVKGHAAGAATLFLVAGPDGDPALLRERPNDPQVIAWKKQAVAYLSDAALGGDIPSMIHLQLQQFKPEEMGAPLPLLYAAHMAVVQITQHDIFNTAPELLESVRKQLTPAQLDTAKSMAGDMVAASRKRQEFPPATAAN